MHTVFELELSLGGIYLQTHLHVCEMTFARSCSLPCSPKNKQRKKYQFLGVKLTPGHPHSRTLCSCRKITRVHKGSLVKGDLWHLLSGKEKAGCRRMCKTRSLELKFQHMLQCRWNMEHYAKCKKLDTQILYDSTYTKYLRKGKAIATKRRMVVSRSWKEGGRVVSA